MSKHVRIQQTRSTTGPTPGTPTPDISDEELRDKVRCETERLFLRQAQTALEHGAEYGSFFILLAALHHLAGLNWGKGKVEGCAFRRFCQTYLAQYDADTMWSHLRCGMFHRGVPASTSPRPANTKQVMLTTDGPAAHDPNGSKKTHAGAITLDAQTLLDDLRAALNSLLEDAAKCPQAMNKCREAYRRYRPVTLATGEHSR